MSAPPPALHLSRAELELLLRYLPGVATRPGENETLRNVRHEPLEAFERLDAEPVPAK